MKILKKLDIEAFSEDSLINLALDTLNMKKQAIIFVNSKAGAEKCAEDIVKKIKTENNETLELANQVLHILSSPTKQCKRLAFVLRKGVAFHHAGLNAKQRDIIEENFRNGKIKIICATPTLAMGIDMPAYRTIIRDLHRYGGPWGMSLIPVLEYHQMSGRAGRPGKGEFGEAIIVAKKKSDIKKYVEHYIFGEPEKIYSKLAVEPVLRTYVLSLIASEFVYTKKELLDFFSKTFYAYQYKDLKKMNHIIEKTLAMLKEWNFLSDSETSSFKSASSFMQEKISATFLGKRVAELYIDPYTAHNFVVCLKRAPLKHITPFSFLQLISYSLEMRPLLKTTTNEYEEIMEQINLRSDEILTYEPSSFEADYEMFIDSWKTTLFFEEWINEKDEDYLFEKYNIRPGEINAKIEMADWLLYSCHELARILKLPQYLSFITKLRLRLKYGVKEELLSLLRLKGIGKIRARKLFSNGIKDLGDVKKTKIEKLINLLGKSVAEDIKKQVDENIIEEGLAEEQKQLKLVGDEFEINSS